jgi:hypothetical protein
MTKKINFQRTNEEDRYYDEARFLFITGTDLDKIVETIPVSLSTLKRWQAIGVWERKKEIVAEHPKFIGEVLKGLVKQKFKKLLSNTNEINISNIEELNKVIGLIERLEEHSWDERAAVVEVMSLFGNFARRQMGEKEELINLAKLMEKFFQEMEEN